MPGLTGERFDEERHAEDVENVRQVYQRHLLQVGAVDTWLGRLLAHLEEIGDLRPGVDCVDGGPRDRVPGR